MIRRTAAALSGAALMLAVAGCGGGGSDSSAPPEPAPAEPATITIPNASQDYLDKELAVAVENLHDAGVETIYLEKGEEVTFGNWFDGLLPTSNTVEAIRVNDAYTFDVGAVVKADSEVVITYYWCGVETDSGCLGDSVANFAKEFAITYVEEYVEEKAGL